MKKKEIIIFAIIFAVAVISIFAVRLATAGDAKGVLITVDGEEYRKIKLTEKTEMVIMVETEYGINEVFISNGSVNVIYADCPNQICVETKDAVEIGDLIVCLPHKMVVEIISWN